MQNAHVISTNHSRHTSACRPLLLELNHDHLKKLAGKKLPQTPPFVMAWDRPIPPVSKLRAEGLKSLGFLSALAPLCMTTKTSDKSASRRPLQLCLFDARRGDREGEEHDKLLGYYPTDVPTVEQCHIVGLVQASQTFLETFDGVGTPHIVFLLSGATDQLG